MSDPKHIMSPEHRYQRDAMFRGIVDMLEAWIHRAKLTPTEVREAAVLATIHYEARRTDGPIYIGGAFVPREQGGPVPGEPPPVVIVDGRQYRLDDAEQTYREHMLWASALSAPLTGKPLRDLASTLGIPLADDTYPCDRCDHCHKSMLEGSHGSGVCVPPAEGEKRPRWFKDTKAPAPIEIGTPEDAERLLGGTLGRDVARWMRERPGGARSVEVIDGPPPVPPMAQVSPDEPPRRLKSVREALREHGFARFGVIERGELRSGGALVAVLGKSKFTVSPPDYALELSISDAPFECANVNRDALDCLAVTGTICDLSFGFNGREFAADCVVSSLDIRADPDRRDVSVGSLSLNGAPRVADKPPPSASPAYVAEQDGRWSISAGPARDLRGTLVALAKAGYVGDKDTLLALKVNGGCDLGDGLYITRTR